MTIDVVLLAVLPPPSVEGTETQPAIAHPVNNIAKPSLYDI